MITLDKLREFKKGDKVTLYKLNIYDEPFAILGTLLEDGFKEWGYYKRSGGWGLSRISEDEEVCYEIQIRPYKKRSVYRFRTGFEIVDIKKGWIE